MNNYSHNLQFDLIYDGNVIAEFIFNTVRQCLIILIVQNETSRLFQIHFDFFHTEYNKKSISDLVTNRRYKFSTANAALHCSTDFKQMDDVKLGH